MSRIRPMSRSVLVGMTAVALAGACESHPTASIRSPENPSFAVLGNDRLPFAFDVVACEEVVAVSGTFHFVEAFTQTPTGRAIFRSHINAKGIGVGATTGARYQWNDAINLTDHFGGPTGVFTATQTTRLVGQGGASDLLFRARFHVTVNANGELTALVDVVEVICS